MGAHNAVGDLMTAHLSNHRIRLGHAEHRPAVLREIDRASTHQGGPSERLQDDRSDQSPSPEHDAGQGRREAQRAGQSHGPEGGGEPRGPLRGRLAPQMQ
ncbi:hypothetical protein HPB50_002887 [Hyalomma asiaticum]|uniref:Uncharacterized protein n=1 Tax=Hyalomma asiaticum TaxID=266040 RepID=A0ACB7SBN6_HYAAI|nr:hypothetical protein HPB50_002887 [Hyalomma asiaticum]